MKDDLGHMSALKRWMPFTAEQTVNILSEFGPLVLMFIVNATYGIAAGTWALIISTVVAIVAMLIVLRRLPVFPLIASTVTAVFGGPTIVTKDPMWVQIKVTIFNAMFALFLFGGLWLNRNFFKYVFEKTFHYSKEGCDKFTWNFAWFFVFTASPTSSCASPSRTRLSTMCSAWRRTELASGSRSRSRSSCRCRRRTPGT
jgi:intracellular septation protein